MPVVVHLAVAKGIVVAVAVVMFAHDNKLTLEVRQLLLPSLVRQRPV